MLNLSILRKERSLDLSSYDFFVKEPPCDSQHSLQIGSRAVGMFENLGGQAEIKGFYVHNFEHICSMRFEEIDLLYNE